MILNIYAVRDSAVEAFLQPFFSPTHGAAIRSLTEAANDPKHPFFTGSKYYSLYHIGSFDDSIGQIIPLDPPRAEHIVDCIQLLNKA
jgi:hypothetical protein